MPTLTLDSIRNMHLPLGWVAGFIVTVVAVTWAAFVWADDIADKQLKTQDQLDQLILIVTTTTTKNADVHDELEDNIDDVEKAFLLLKQEMELRRELREGDGGT